MLNETQLEALRESSGSPNRIKFAMSLANVTQVQVAAEIGSTQPHVAEIANGNYSRLPLETARKFAAFFGCAIEDLFPPSEAKAS